MLALWLARVASAQDVGADAWQVPPPPSPVVRSVPLVDPVAARWQRRDQRARGTYTAGVLTGLTGLTFDAVGWYTDNEDLRSIGSLGELLGSPLMAGGSLRSARALREQGVQVGRGWGAVSWNMWSAAFLFQGAADNAKEEESSDSTSTFDNHHHHDKSAQQSSEVLTWVGVGCRVGAYLAAGLQASSNAHARREFGLAGGGEASRSSFAIGPTFDGQAVGIVVSSEAF